jgi:hypothetical protein
MWLGEAVKERRSRRSSSDSDETKKMSFEKISCSVVMKV